MINTNIDVNISGLYSNEDSSVQNRKRKRDLDSEKSYKKKFNEHDFSISKYADYYLVSHEKLNQKLDTIEEYLEKKAAKYGPILEKAQISFKEIKQNYVLNNNEFHSLIDNSFNIEQDLLYKVIRKGTLSVNSLSGHVNQFTLKTGERFGVFNDQKGKLNIFRFEGTQINNKSPNFLGKGASGNVQKIDMISQGKQAALKIANNQDENKFIQNEAAVLNVINPNSNWVGLQNSTEHNIIFSNDDLLGYITKLYNKNSLKDVTIHHFTQTLSNQERIEQIANLFSGLVTLHQSGYIHGDIKPGNCFVNETINVIGRNIEFVIADVGGSFNTNKISKESLEKVINNLGTSYTKGYFTKSDALKISRLKLAHQVEQWVLMNQQRDVFALATTIWYFLTQKMPFPQPENLRGYPDTSSLQNISEVELKIGKEGSHELVQALSEDPTKRPTAKSLFHLFNKMIKNNDPDGSKTDTLELSKTSSLIQDSYEPTEVLTQVV